MARRRIIRYPPMRGNVPNGDAGLVVTASGVDTNSPGSGDELNNDGSAPPESASSPEPAESIAGFESIDPGSVGNDSDGSGPRKRGRPKGSRNRTGATPSQKAANSLETLNALLFSVHAMAAAGLNIPELALEADECKRLSEAIDRVSGYYPIGMSDKHLAWVNLAMCGISVYGKRAGAIFRNKKGPQNQRPKPVMMPKPSPAPTTQAGYQNGAPAPGGLAPSDIFNMPPIDGGE